ncbi:MAG: hypothetical protein JO033_27185 [Acidobacteriaceae bacterium]|nr:hypothetical protein [Acidobacteriaceae bacterium]MBV9502798.1 hypothetical protein [Acidobacteriaceae bacterium]
MPRPSFQPTEQQRKLINSVSALAVRQDQICKLVGLRSPKTLRKHFRAELDQGTAEACLAVIRTAYEMATSGRYPQMSIFWEKCQRPAGEPEREQQREPRKRRAGAQRGRLVFIHQDEDLSDAA